MQYDLSLDWQDFLANYWQKKPLLIRQAFKQFVDPISPEELAGLAMEESIDSRLVTNKNNKWHLQHGPIEDFSKLGETNWSILVQAVNHWFPAANALIAPFRTLPDWRLDDLMVSYSTPNAGVGPHVDQYDVFIIQGMGRRHWRVGERQPVKNATPHPQLLQVEGFISSIDEILLPGDMLYIPPHCPHEGYAIEPSLNYSIGFRAPNQRELLSSFADFIIEHDHGKTRYQDSFAFDDLTQLPRANFFANSSANNAAILPLEIAALRNQMLSLLNDEECFSRWLGQYLSESRHELDILPVDDPVDADDIYQSLNEGYTICKVNGLRVLTVEDNTQLFINGMTFKVDNTLLRHALTSQSHITLEDYSAINDDKAAIELLCELIQLGYWYIDTDEDME